MHPQKISYSLLQFNFRKVGRTLLTLQFVSQSIFYLKSTVVIIIDLILKISNAVFLKLNQIVPKKKYSV
jgi:hypothetical protein